MATNLSKTQVDQLGDRLRRSPIEEADLRILDDYRRSFRDAYERVVRAIRERLHVETTGRWAKSTSSILEKLRREKIRLSQMQDIAGCRVIVADILDQDRLNAALSGMFVTRPDKDRRTNPSHGYRAVHVVAEESGKLVEIQIRTQLQHLWAELSERLADRIDPTIKYGGGREEVRLLLAAVSKTVELVEDGEREVAAHHDDRTRIESLGKLKQELARGLNELIEFATIDPEKTGKP